MFLFKRHISRRTFLRGTGVSLALPLLDSMVPAATALAQTSAKPLLRAAFVYVPMGAVMADWTPSAEGTGFEFPLILKPIERFKERINVITGTMSHGPNGHPASPAMWLTGVVPPHGSLIRQGVSADQLIAAQFAEETTYTSLEVATEDHSTALGSCGGDFPCAIMNTISWRNATTPNPMELNPRTVFEKLFGGDALTAKERLTRLRDNRSILDGITRSIREFGAGLGAADQARLNDYLDNIREIERRLQRSEKQNAESTIQAPDAPLGIPESWEEHLKLMYDLIVVAFQADVTRVASYMVARELSGKTHPMIGVPEGWHGVSHHQNNPANMARCAKIQSYHMSLFGDFLQKLQSTPEGTGNLLDNAMIMYGSGMSNSNEHVHNNLPIVIAGGAAGGLKGHRHIRVADGTPLSNLLLGVVEKAGVRDDQFGDSTGRISL